MQSHPVIFVVCCTTSLPMAPKYITPHYFLTFFQEYGIQDRKPSCYRRQQYYASCIHIKLPVYCLVFLSCILLKMWIYQQFLKLVEQREKSEASELIFYLPSAKYLKIMGPNDNTTLKCAFFHTFFRTCWCPVLKSLAIAQSPRVYFSGIFGGLLRVNRVMSVLSAKGVLLYMFWTYCFTITSLFAFLGKKTG